MIKLTYLLFIALSLNIVSCTSTQKIPASKDSGISSLAFLSEYVIPFGMAFNNTTVGGLSGIDYDSVENVFYLICDDRSAINPARFYTARIHISNKIDSVVFINVASLLQPNGKEYPNSRQDPYHTPDPESIRYNPVKRQLVWTSEGERNIRNSEAIIAAPSIRIMDVQGKYIDSFIIPRNLHIQATENGPRQNGVFEGMTYADNFNSLYVSVEEPLYEDGPTADITRNDAFIRITKFDTKSKAPVAQYAYELDPVAYPAFPEDAYKINGVPEILSLGDNKLLVIERSYSTGRIACVVKVFVASLSNATDVMNIASLKDKGFKAVEKRLLLNMDSLGMYIDNIEGVTFGPQLKNGNRTLLFVADNNFNPLEKAQLLLFEVKE